jgi:C4-dicarboxylate transporter DctM subunit
MEPSPSTTGPIERDTAVAEGAVPDSQAEPRTPLERTAYRAGQILDVTSLVLQAAALSALLLLVLAAIVARYLFSHALLYENDLITLLFIWSIFAGIGRATWRGDLLRTGLWKRAHGRTRAVIDGVAAGTEIALFAVLIWSMQQSTGADLKTQIPTLGIPVFAESLAIGVGAALGIAAAVLSLVAHRAPVLTYIVALISGAAAWVWVIYGTPSGGWVLLILLLMLLSDVPMAVAIGLAGAALAIAGDVALNLSQIVHQPIDSVSDVAFIALPLFMMLGGLVAKTGLARELGALLRMIFKPLPGGVGVACIGAAGVLANMTGSPLADTAALGTVFIPELRESGYSKAEAGALQACAGLLGMVFPPAVVLIIWATLVNVSVTAEFRAATVAGVLLALAMVVVVLGKGILMARRGLRPARTRTTLPMFMSALLGAVPVLMIPVIVDWGIFSGVFAAYEAGAIATVAAGGIGAARRKVRLKQIPDVLAQAADTTSMVAIILGTLGILKYGLFISGVEDRVGHLLNSMVGSVFTFWIVVNLAFMLLHEFVEPTPAILLLAPFIVPLATGLHISLLQLGVVIVVNSTIGLVLPPLGVNLYLAAKLADVPSGLVLRRVWPYLVASLVVLVLVCAVPGLSTSIL